jgi:hypothetical protein
MQSVQGGLLSYAPGLLSYAERPGRLAELCPWLAELCRASRAACFPYTVSHGSPYTVSHGFSYTGSPGHHGQEHSIGTKAAISENLQLALVAGVMANGPPEPP